MLCKFLQWNTLLLIFSRAQLLCTLNRRSKRLKHLSDKLCNSRTLALLLLSLTSGYPREGRRCLCLVILCSHLRVLWGIHPHLAVASHHDFLCFCFGECGDTQAGMCVIRKGKYNLTVKVLSPVSGLVLPTKTSITNPRERFHVQCWSKN